MEAAPGPLPPSALSPVLRARETGPSVIDLTLEVLERVADGEPKKAVLGEKTIASTDHILKNAFKGFEIISPTPSSLILFNKEI